MLEILIIVPLIGSFLLLFINKNNKKLIRLTSLWTSLITFFLSVILWLSYDYFSPKLQFITNVSWLESLNMSFCLGIDSISLLFIVLTTFIFPLCILSSWSNIKRNFKEYMITFLIMESFLLLVFCLLDLLLFYVFFESILIPMFLIVGIWGSRSRKIRASYMLFFYTLFGSIFMLLAILILFLDTGTTDYQLLLVSDISPFKQKLLWLAFFIAFASKIPMLPFHIWLPEAHVEAPTTGSVILAGILLKLGSYGFIRFSLPLFPIGSIYFTPLVYSIATVGIVYTSLTAIRQTDLKRVIAYASIAHMNLIMLGLFSLNIQGVEGSIIQMISHGVVSSALFLCVGIVYDRHHTRILKYFGGLANTMPFFIVFFLLFIFANAALPGTCNFVGEVLLFTGIFQDNVFVTIFAALGIVLSGAYSLWLFNRIAYGNIKMQNIDAFGDMCYREFMILLPLGFLTIFLGIYPNCLIDKLHMIQIY
jgi:proton-translocating NADH-quinone oxidoreductase chain M